MPGHEHDYGAWVASHHQLTEADRAAIRAHLGWMPHQQSFLLVPLVRADDTPILWQPVLQAAQEQLYPHWQIALPACWPPGDQSGDGHAVRAADPPPEPEGQRHAFLNAICSQDGQAADFIVPLPPGALLDERALYEFAVASAAAPQADVLYGDQDQVDGPGATPHSPRFKTGFDPELMLGRDALGLPVAYRSTLLRRLGGLSAGVMPIGVALHDLALRAWEAAPADRFRHVPAVLCHCARRAGGLPEWEPRAARAVMRRHVHACEDADAVIQPAPLAPAWCRVKRSLPAAPPLVSIIVPTRNGATLLRNCVDGLLHRTDYPRLELLIVDNGSDDPEALSLLSGLEHDPRVRVLRRPGPFNYSALNNAAAGQATGDVLLLLNNDTEIMASDWLGEMVSHALRPDVGAVGAKLHYADGRIQHAGVVLGRKDMLAHQLRLSAPDDPGPQGELALARTVLAVTGACLALRRSVFWEVGGLDEGLATAFNDVDLCLRLGDHGYRIVWTPFAALRHLESASRGLDTLGANRDRLLRDLAVIQNRWPGDLQEDAFHNPNVTFGWDGTTLASPPRRAKPWDR